MENAGKATTVGRLGVCQNLRLGLKAEHWIQKMQNEGLPVICVKKHTYRGQP